MSALDFAARALAARNSEAIRRRLLLDRIERNANRAALANPRIAGLFSATITDNGATPPAATSGTSVQAFNGTNPVFKRIGGTYAATGARAALYSSDIGTTGGNFGSSDGKQVSYWRAAFMHTGRYVAFRLNPSVSAQRFLVDGKYVSTDGSTIAAVVLGTTTGSTHQYLLLDLGSRATRRIEYEGQTTCSLVGIYTEATGKLHPVVDDRVRFAFLGDSVIDGTGPTHHGDGLVPVMADWLGADMLASGSGGTGWLQAGAGVLKFHERIAAGDLALGGTPEVIVLGASTNDKALTQATVQANALAGLQSARALYPLAPIVVFGCPAGNSGPDANVLASEASVQAAVAAFADPLCRFVPVSADPAGAWVTGTGYAGATTGSGTSDWVNADQAHPTTEGAGALGRRYAAAARDALRTILAA